MQRVNLYDPYGRIDGDEHVGVFSYTGQQYIPEIDLHHYKARYYHADIGRFLQTDPIGYEADMNLYGYAFNDPINFTDPNGEMPFPQSFGVSIGCGLSGGGGCGEQIQRANLSEGAGVLLGSTPLLAAGATSAAVPVFLSRAPEITTAAAITSQFIAGPGDDAVSGAPIVLGLGGAGTLARFADEIGGENLMSSISPIQDFLIRVSDPAQRFLFRLDGLRGGSTASEIVDATVAQGRLASATGKIDDGNRTAFELFTLQDNGRFSDTTFFLNGQIVDP